MVGFGWLRWQGGAEKSGDGVGAATSSSGAAAPLTHVVLSTSGAPSLEERLRRVTPQDLEHVSPEAIRQLRRTLTSEELSVAATMMMRENRFGDVVSSCTASSWTAAVAGVRATDLPIAHDMFRDRMSWLYNILPYLPEELAQSVSTVWGSRQCDA